MKLQVFFLYFLLYVKYKYMGSKDLTTLVYNSIIFPTTSTITDASFIVPNGKYGNTAKCLLFKKNSSSLTNISINNQNQAVVNKKITFKLSNTVSGTITSADFFASGSVSVFNGYISGTTLTCTDTSPQPIQICPTFQVTGAGVTVNTIITRQATLSASKVSEGFSGKDGTYIINNNQTVGSAGSLIEFTCIPQASTFVGALRIDASNNINGTTTSLYINKGNAYQTSSFPVLGMTLSGNAIKFGGNPLSNVQIYNRADGSPSNPYIKVTTTNSGVSTYTSLSSQVLLTTKLDSSGCMFKGLVSGSKLTATSIIFGSIQSGHSLTGGNDTLTLTTPAPTISSFIADGSYNITCNCSINSTATTLEVHSVEDGYQIPNFSSTSPVKFYIFLLPQKNGAFAADTYILAYGTGGATINGKGTTGKYTLNKNYTGSNITKKNIQLTVQTTVANSGSIGQYILSSSQPNIKISATDFLLTGPIMTGTLI